MSKPISTDSRAPQGTFHTSPASFWAVVFVVTVNAGAAPWLSDALSFVAYPLLLLTSGFVLAQHAGEGIAARLRLLLRHVYVPFVVWGIVLSGISRLLLTAEPFSLHGWIESAWHITFTLSGFDATLCQPFWFMRALLWSSVALMLLNLLARRLFPTSSPLVRSGIVTATAFALSLWQSLETLPIGVLPHGGSRELYSLLLLAAGQTFAYGREILTKEMHQGAVAGKRWTLICGGVLTLWLFTACTDLCGMPTRFTWVDVCTLWIPALAGSIAVWYVSRILLRLADAFCPVVSRCVAYGGRHALVILAFHTCATLGVYLLLPAEGFWVTLLGIVCGIVLPLAVRWAWRRVMPHGRALTLLQRYAPSFLQYVVLALRTLARWTFVALRATWHVLCHIGTFFVAFIHASSPRKEQADDDDFDEEDEEDDEDSEDFLEDEEDDDSEEDFSEDEDDEDLSNEDESDTEGLENFTRF